jgi:hypothetical protein
LLPVSSLDDKDGHINSGAKKKQHKIDNAITVNNKVDHGNRNIKNCKESCFIASEIEDNKKKHGTKRKSLRGNKKKEESKTSISQNNNNKIKHDKRKRCGNEIITPLFICPSLLTELSFLMSSIVIT